MASYEDIPMNSFDRYVESMRTRRPGVTAARALASGQLDSPQIGNTGAAQAPTAAEDAYAKFAAARAAEDQYVDNTLPMNPQAIDASMVAEAALIEQTGMSGTQYEDARAMQKAQEQAVTSAALDKFMAAQNRQEAIDPRMIQQ